MGWMKDARYGLRQLRRTPGFVFVAVITLALGIGANAAVFSVMNAVLLRYLPVPDPQQLVVLHYTEQPDNSGQTGHDDTSLPENGFEALRQQRSIFSDLMAYVPLGFPNVAVRYGSAPEEAAGDEVSGNFFSGLRVQILRGRGFTADDEKKHTQVAVLSYAFWNSRFGNNPSVLGQTMFVKGVPFTIVGVAAPGFIGLEREKATDFWVPFQNDPRLKPWGRSIEDKQGLYNTPDWFFLMTIGRLRPGVSLDRAQAQLEPVFRQAVYSALGQPKPGEKLTGLRLTAARGIEGASESYKAPLLSLMAMVGLVLLIACSNVAMLLLARNAERQREFGVRLALGASSSTIFRQLLTESLLLVCAGGLLGWGFALLATRALAAWSQMDVSLAPDFRVLLFAIAICATAALVFGLAPLPGILRGPGGFRVTTSAASSNQTRQKKRMRQAVVALQIAICLMLLVGSSLLVRTLQNLENANLGQRAQGLLVFGIQPPDSVRGDAETLHFFDTLVARMRMLPGVESATLVEERPGAGWSNNTAVKVDGVSPNGKKFAPLRWNAVGPDFFHAMNIPVLLGRDLNDADTAGSAPVVIVNQTFVNQYLGGGQPLGHQLSKWGEDKNPATIVGVVADSKYTSVRESPRPMAYYPYTQIPNIAAMQIELRTHGNPTAMLPQVRSVMQQFGPDVPLLDPMSQEEQFTLSFSTDRLFARLAVFFGVLAVFLVGTGLYGAMAYRVSRRTAEIGMRMALGAQRGQVLWMVLQESLLICVAGVAIGLPAAFAGARLLRSMLFNLSPFDVLSFVVALAGIAAVTVVATAVPARRASAVDPLIALRYE
ncbi:MAG TPA: ABC transporter permease [Candidatus Acidoferrales bacterium]|jgi:predicted permease|nr:ABC transporter permease [Candidatus Acidoferrales bacterium]